MSDLAREEILGRIGAAQVPIREPFERRSVENSLRNRSEIIDQFIEYAGEYKAHVVRVTLGQLPATIAALLAARSSYSVVVPADLPQEWLPEGLGEVRDRSHTYTELDQIRSVITGCAVGIAETGTIVLDAGPNQGRRAITLIPDHHICLIFDSQIVDSVPEAVAALASAVQMGRPLTWVSGPSATSDIELNRVEGVHGPRNLDILVIATAGE